MSNQIFNYPALASESLSGEYAIVAVTVYALLGLALGSFATMAVHRWPSGEPWVTKRSHCPSCGTTLGIRDLIPLFSWLWQRGRCRYCRTLIPSRYPLLEAACMTLALICLWLYGPGITSILVLLMLVALGIMVVVDWQHTIIPDETQVIVATTGLMYAWMHDSLTTNLLTAVGVGAAGYLLAYTYRLLRGRDGLGMGDIKFFAAAGCWLGWIGFLPFICYAGAMGAAFGTIWARRQVTQPFPFGPALAASLALCVLWPTSAAWFWNTIAQGAERLAALLT